MRAWLGDPRVMQGLMNCVSGYLRYEGILPIRARRGPTDAEAAADPVGLRCRGGDQPAGGADRGWSHQRIQSRAPLPPWKVPNTGLYASERESHIHWRLASRCVVRCRIDLLEPRGWFDEGEINGAESVR